MAHVLFGGTTAVVAIDPNITAPYFVDALFVDATFDDATVETPAITTEATLFDEPMPIPSVTEPAYLIEVETARRPGRLIAVRVTLDDAMYVAESIHPGVGEVTIREVALPCDADTFCASTSRTWSRGPEGGFRLRP